MEWQWLGAGSFGVVLGATPAAPATGRELAVKFHLDDEPADVAEEAHVARLLQLLDAPSFIGFYGAARLGPAHQAKARRLIQALAPAALPAQLVPRFVTVSELVRGGLIVRTLLSPTAHAEGTGRIAAFQLAWSLAVAQAKIGFESRDLWLSNLLWHRVPATAGGARWEHYVLAAGATETVFSFRTRGRVVVIDHGKSTVWDPRRGALRRPDATNAELTVHSPPELYFPRRYGARTAAAEWWQYGVVLWSMLVLPQLTPLPPPEALHGSYDLLDWLLDVDADAHGLYARFVALLVELLPTAGRVAADTGAHETWVRRLRDPQRAYGNLHGRYLAVALAQRALGSPTVAPPRAAAAVDGGDDVFYRLVADARVQAFVDGPAAAAVGARYAAAAAALGAEGRALVRRLLAWEPAARPDGAAVLADPLFAPLRATGGAVVYPANEVPRFFDWRAEPPLTAAVSPQRHDARLMGLLAAASAAADAGLPPPDDTADTPLDSLIARLAVT